MPRPTCKNHLCNNLSLAFHLRLTPEETASFAQTTAQMFNEKQYVSTQCHFAPVANSGTAKKAFFRADHRYEKGGCKTVNGTSLTAELGALLP